MANDISARPWSIDTAGAGVIYQPQAFVKFIEVIGGAAGAQGGDMAIINDRNSKRIIYAKYQTVLAGELQTFNIENWYEGLIVPTLGTGVVVLIHVK